MEAPFLFIFREGDYLSKSPVEPKADESSKGLCWSSSQIVGIIGHSFNSRSATVFLYMIIDLDLSPTVTASGSDE